MQLKALRMQLRQRRKQLSPKQRSSYSHKACLRAIEILADNRFKRVATFLSMAEEIDTAFLNKALLADDYQLYLPYVSEKEQPLKWVAYRHVTTFVRDTVGMLAPDYHHEPTIAAHELDAVITPLVGFDKLGNRLGMGGGYYDRSFAFKSLADKPYLLGFAYACQQVDSLVSAPWDIPLDGVITEQDVVFFNSNQ